jgi:hypothetical protein
MRSDFDFETIFSLPMLIGGGLMGFLASILCKNDFFSFFFVLIFGEYYFENFWRGSGDDMLTVVLIRNFRC